MWRPSARLVGAVLLVPGLVLAGCAEGSSQEQVAEKAIEDATGGRADVDVDAEEVTVESEDGTVTMGKDLPDDFPAGVPVPEGEVQSATSLQGRGWAVTLKAEGNAASVAAAIRKQLTDGGFEVNREDEVAGGRMLIAIGEHHQVTASVSAASGVTGVVYTVAPKQG